MAEKKKEESKITLEREYNIPLRRRFVNIPRYQRTKKAVKTVREFIAKHMKSDTIKLGDFLNRHLWNHGAKNPPHHVAVIAQKDDKGTVKVEMKGAPVKRNTAVRKVIAKKETGGGIADTLKSALKPGADKPAEKSESKPAESKPAEKAESKPEVKDAEIVSEKKE